MTQTPKDSQMFLAYHIRSAFLTSEAAFRQELTELNFSLDHFYVLRCEWKATRTSLTEISAHAMKTKDETQLLLDDLITKNYVIKDPKEDHFLLSAQGLQLRTQALDRYRQHLSKANKGLSKNMIEAALSTLLTIQNNIQT